MTQSIIPPKPNDVTWTFDQWRAIYAKNQDILVAAAAGSGKTAVLVERMIQRILSKDDPVNVDELLVVTFTNASAAEMRHRIGEALEKAIQADPKSINLKKQLTLLNRAAISTLHSFCLEVIRKYYYVINIDPSFRIADETEAQLIRDEVMDDLFEEEYGKNDNEAFFSLVDAYTNDHNDAALQNIIRDVYEFAMSNPSPEGYLKSMVAMYDVDETMEITKLPFVKMLLDDVELQLTGARQILEQGLSLTKVPGGPAPRAENFVSDIEFVEALLSAKNDSWESLYNLIQTIPFSRAKTCRGDEYDPELLKKAQDLRTKAKKMLTDLQTELFSRKPSSFLKDMSELKSHIETIVGLVLSFASRFAAAKMEKGLVDFADIEHHCLAILTESVLEDGTRLPSAAAVNYQQRFKEVLVDEYQDTNMVQEAILQLVKSGNEETGNLFMVGDVKQSIYRFRLAEPNLFLGKYQRFSSDGEAGGLRIDLAQNFRSRGEVLAGTNYLFKQIMGEKVGEITYDEAAELKLGASYPSEEAVPVELMLIDQTKTEESNESAPEENSESLEDAGEAGAFDRNDLEQSQLEARLIARRISEIIAERKPVYNPKSQTTRPIMYRDIVILLRSMTWAQQMIEELKAQGIPVYANLSTGYFDATEVAIVLSLLKIIDNPYQDIPFAAVLRSPIVGLTEPELAQIRIYQKSGTFYEAFASFCQRQPEGSEIELFEKVRPFFLKLTDWRTRARQGSLSQFIWQLLKETRFYEFVGGMPGGKQRQANLRALFDRARAYEATSFRGLFRFLRFVERMRDRGDDLGAARALGEQEDVVRIMTIHSSKGLEFPVVFIAGLNRRFNMMDLRKMYMLDKEYGLAAKYVSTEKRISYPSLPQLAFKRKKKMEMLAEEMRILYVALTRAKEKLYMTASVRDLAKSVEKWSMDLHHPDWQLPEFERASAASFLDWIGPSLVRHHDCADLLSKENGNFSSIASVPEAIGAHPSSWRVTQLKAEEVRGFEKAEEETVNLTALAYVEKGEPVPLSTDRRALVKERLSWKYGFLEASGHRAKQSVSEIKRQQELFNHGSGTELQHQFAKPLFNRPRFMQEKTLTPAERGTAMHMVMQHVDLTQAINELSLGILLEQMVEKELLSIEQKEVIDVESIILFFESSIGKRLLAAPKVRREVPFSISLPSSEVYHDWKDEHTEQVMIQGIIDCLFEDEQGLVLLDYKTDSIKERFKGGFREAAPILEDRYKVQISLYRKAIEQILKTPVNEAYLFFFDGGKLLKMN